MGRRRRTSSSKVGGGVHGCSPAEMVAEMVAEVVAEQQRINYKGVENVEFEGG